MTRTTNQITTGKIAGTVYDLRHWRMALFVFCILGSVRFLAGLDVVGGGRHTDATFGRSAVRLRRSWWADRPGYVRVAIRLAPIVVLWAYFTHRTALIASGWVLAAWGLCVIWRVWRVRSYERAVLYPVWPAVAHIIGVDETEHPSAWLHIPQDYGHNPQACIAVGLLPHTITDDQQAYALLTLFGQRLLCPHIATVDHPARLIRLQVRPPDPEVWPAVAKILNVKPGVPSGRWLAMPPDATVDGSHIVVRIPDDETDADDLAVTLKDFMVARFKGKWSRRIVADATLQDEPVRAVVLTRQTPPPEPPNRADFFDAGDDNA